MRRAALYQRLRRGAELALPYGVTLLRQRRGRANVLAARARRLEAGAASLADRRASRFSYEEAIDFLTARGLDRGEVMAGSMPRESLDFLASFLNQAMPRDRAPVALHIGNFLGVSLAYLTDALRRLHPGSVVVSVDPDIPHRGIARPAEHAVALLGHFGLLDRSLLLTGYTLGQNTGDDTDANPAVQTAEEQRPERVLANLALALPGRFDAAVVDGNHEGAYLARELTYLRRILRPGGLLAVDDLDLAMWEEVVQAYERALAGGAFEELGRDDRVGVMRMSAGQSG